MIRYTLRCAHGHRFDSWFQSGGAYDDLADKGLLSCAVCGSTDVEKAMMAPPVAAKDNAKRIPAPSKPDLGQQGHPAEAMLKAMREHVEKNSTYVGGNFAREARSMHLGDTPEKAIHGEANAEEAKSLLEDGVPILPVPGPPPSKTN